MKSVLIVENDPTISDMLRATFEIQGYAVTTFTNEHTAGTWLAEAFAHNQAPTHVLLNISEYNNDGQWFLQHLNSFKATYTLPSLVLMTADSRSYQEFGVPVLHKPFHLKDLLDTIKAL